MKQPDFIEFYLDWCGPSECPREYLKWSAISLLAAACSKRVFTVRKIGYREMRLYPNLYMILVGPSANFKSFARTQLKTILEASNYKSNINVFDGHITHAGVYDALRDYEWITGVDGKRRKDHNLYSHRKWLYLLNDEIASDVGKAEDADMLIRTLVRLYFGGPIDDRTRTNGLVHLDDCLINWFACSTLEWLLSAISRESLTAGFLRRTILIPQKYSDERIFEADPPDDWDTKFKYLVNRIDELFTYGPDCAILLNKDAKRVAKAWYMSRETPREDDLSMSSWRNQYDLSLKLATILAVSRHRTAIDDEILAEAQDLTDQVVTWQQGLMPQLLRGTRGANEEHLLGMIRARGRISRSKLMHEASNKFNMRSPELDVIVRTWLEAGEIVEHRRPRSKGGTVYEPIIR